MKRVLTIASLAAAAALTFSACSATTPADQPAPASSTTVETPPAPVPPAAPSSAPTPTAGQTVKFDETATEMRVPWGVFVEGGTGLTITVDAPEPYVPSAAALKPTGTGLTFMTVTVTVKNNTATKYETADFSWTPVAGGAVPAAKVYDSVKSTPPVGNPFAKLAPGGSATWKEPFGVDATAVASFEVETSPRGLAQGPTFTNTP